MIKKSHQRKAIINQRINLLNLQAFSVEGISSEAMKLLSFLDCVPTSDGNERLASYIEERKLKRSNNLFDKNVRCEDFDDEF